MPKIVKVRPVLLSAPYAQDNDFEVLIHLKSGMRTCGLVEITLEDGTTGLGEGYIAVFAPYVFVELVKLMEAVLVGKEAFDTIARYNDCCNISNYFSFQGAARHVIGACEIALLDAKAKVLGIPVYSLFGGKTADSLEVYGSTDCGLDPQYIINQINMLAEKGIDILKIRARKNQVKMTSWVMKQAQALGIKIAVDMGQNLDIPAQTISDVVQYVRQVHERAETRIFFLEEVLGPMDVSNYPLLKNKVEPKICGGEIITTSFEFYDRIERNIYDFVQPDATVVGGIAETLKVCSCAQLHGSDAVVHCWGGGVGLMANYHAAYAAGCKMTELPLKKDPLRTELMIEPLCIKKGKLYLSSAPGLGVCLTKEIETKYPFKEEAVYKCNGDRSIIPNDNNWNEDI